MDLKIIKSGIFNYFAKAKDWVLKSFNYLKAKVQLPEYDCFILGILLFLITPLGYYVPLAVLGYLLLTLLIIIKCLELIKSKLVRYTYISLFWFWFFMSTMAKIFEC